MVAYRVARALSVGFGAGSVILVLLTENILFLLIAFVFWLGEILASLRVQRKTGALPPNASIATLHEPKWTISSFLMMLLLAAVGIVIWEVT